MENRNYDTRTNFHGGFFVEETSFRSSKTNISLSKVSQRTSNVALVSMIFYRHPACIHGCISPPINTLETKRYEIRNNHEYLKQRDVKSEAAKEMATSQLRGFSHVQTRKPVSDLSPGCLHSLYREYQANIDVTVPARENTAVTRAVVRYL